MAKATSSAETPTSAAAISHAAAGGQAGTAVGYLDANPATHLVGAQLDLAALCRQAFIDRQRDLDLICDTAARHDLDCADIASHEYTTHTTDHRAFNSFCASTLALQ